DCSTDNTAFLAKEAGAFVISHGVNRGQGASLQTGHVCALDLGATHVLHFDGDGQFDVSDILPAYTKLKESGVDVLFGSRFLGKDSNIPFLKRYLFFPIGRLINRLFARVRLRDVHNGFRILNRKALLHVVITQDGMAHATQIPALVQRYKLQYIEHPVLVTYHEFGQGLRGGVTIVRDLFMDRFIR
ncbi:MAG: glycosyltransferase family 2 protein, partial [Candidatus Magasanikbacteria bacterium]|nr:glycosyltransferase family 2 protein [Candidatus Magasanikbacteria bacterium]